jgi:hypothetical protein
LLRLRVSPSGQVQFSHDRAGELTSEPVLEIGYWHHVAVVLSPEQARLYVDGIEVASGPVGVRADPPLEGITFGNNAYPSTPGDSPLGGDLDEIGFYNEALSAADVLALAQAGSTGRCAPDLEISDLTGDQFLEPGTVGKWSCIVRNIGTERATQRSITDISWSTAPFTSNPFSRITVNGEPVTMTLGEFPLPDLDAGESAYVELEGPVSPFPSVTACTLRIWGSPAALIADTSDRNESVALLVIANSPCHATTAGSFAWLAADASGVERLSRAPWTTTGSVLIDQGVAGTGFGFPGSGSLAFPLPPNPGARVGLEAWVKPMNVQDGRQILLSLKPAPGSSNSPQIWLARDGRSLDPFRPGTPGRLRFRAAGIPGLPTDSGGWIDGGVNLPSDVWSLVELDLGHATALLRVNGTETARFQFPTNLPSWPGGELRLGGPRPDDASVGVPFNGWMDEVQVHNNDNIPTPRTASLGAGSNGRCPGNLQLEWTSGASVTGYVGVPTPFAMRISNLGTVPMAKPRMQFNINPVWSPAQLQASRGTIATSGNAVTGAINWQDVEPLAPGSTVDLSFTLTLSVPRTNTLSAQTFADTADGIPDNNTVSTVWSVGPGNAELQTVQIFESDEPIRVVEVPVVLREPLAHEARLDVIVEESGRRTGIAKATPGRDFIPGRQTLVFPPQSQRQWMRIEIAGDDVREIQTEEFQIRFENMTGLSVSTTTNALAITDDDPAPRAVLGSPRIIEADQEVRRIAFPVSLSRPTEITTTLQYSTTNGTAIAGQDYVATSGSLVLEPGSVGQIEVDVLGDSIPEPAEWFRIVAAVPSASRQDLLPPLEGGVGLIEDNDSPLTIASLDVTGLPTEAPAGTSLPVSIQAVAPNGSPMPADGERVTLQWFPGAGIPSPVVISEVALRSSAFEIQSTRSDEISLKDWRVEIFARESWPAPITVWIGSDTNRLPAFGVLVIDRGNLNGDARTLGWYATGTTDLRRPAGVVLKDPSGNVVDVFTIGSAIPSTLLTEPRLRDADWPGFSTGFRPQAGFQTSHQRAGAIHRGNSDAWAIAPETLGAANPAFRIPLTTDALEPVAAGEIVLGPGGAWQGSVTSPGQTGPWRLVATASNGRSGRSAPIALGTRQGIAIQAFEVPQQIHTLLTEPTALRLVITNPGPSDVSNVVARIGRTRFASDTNVASTWHTSTVARATLGNPSILGSNAPGGPRIEVLAATLPAGSNLVVDVETASISLNRGIFWASAHSAATETDPTDNLAWATPFWVSGFSFSGAPEAWWRLDGNLRSVRNAPDLQLVGQAEFGAPAFPPHIRLPGNGCLVVPGNIARVEPATNVCVTLWFRTVGNWDRSESYVLFARPLDGTRFEVLLRDGLIVARGFAPNNISPSTVTDLRDGAWHSLEVILRVRPIQTIPADLAVFIDDRFVANYIVPESTRLAGGGVPLWIGGAPGYRGLEGDIADVSIQETTSTISFNRTTSVGPDSFRRAILRGGLHAAPWFEGTDAATQRRPFSVAVLMTNTGPMASTNFSFYLPPTPGVELVSFTGPARTRRSSDGSWAFDLGPAAVGEVRQIDLNLRADQPGALNLVFRGGRAPIDSVADFSRVVTVAPDTDGDGLTDSWEEAIGLSASNPADAGEDPDQDGISNLGEFEAGTSPKDPASVLQLDARIDPTRGLVLGFASVRGRRYQLQRRTDLQGPGGWESISALPGINARIEFTEPSLEGTGPALYRVQAIRDR